MPGSRMKDGPVARWSRWLHRYVDDYDRLTDPVVVASNRNGELTAEQERWYTADQIRSRVLDAGWFAGSAIAAAGSALGWLDPRLLWPLVLFALFSGVLVIRRLRDDPLEDDLNRRSVSFVSGGVEAGIRGRGGYSLDVRQIATPYEGFRRFRIGRTVYDRLPHPTDAERRLIGPNRGGYAPSVTCRAYFLSRSSHLLSVDLIGPGYR